MGYIIHLLEWQNPKHQQNQMLEGCRATGTLIQAAENAK
jgi:hypothetical protein